MSFSINHSTFCVSLFAQKIENSVLNVGLALIIIHNSRIWVLLANVNVFSSSLHLIFVLTDILRFFFISFCMFILLQTTYLQDHLPKSSKNSPSCICTIYKLYLNEVPRKSIKENPFIIIKIKKQ